MPTKAHVEIMFSATDGMIDVFEPEGESCVLCHKCIGCDGVVVGAAAA